MLGLGLGLDGSDGSNASRLAGSEANVVAAIMADNSLVIRDAITPANNYIGPLYNPATGQFNKFTYTCASIAYELVNGIWTQFAVNKPRFKVVNGVTTFTTEPAATNLLLFSRDMTNAAWVKTNATAALTATGADGVANSASTLTATAANATVLQTITQVATNDNSSFIMRRRTGSGVVNITQDGVTFFPVTLTSAFTRFYLAPATLTNPVVGIQIVTSGDAIDVDFGQLETGSVPTSPIVTTTVSVTRAATSLVLASGLFNAQSANGTLYARVNPVGIDQTLQTYFATLDDNVNTFTNSIGVRRGSTFTFPVGIGYAATVVQPMSNMNTSTVVAGVQQKIAASFVASGIRSAYNSVAGTAGAAITMPTGLSTLRWGCAEFGSSVSPSDNAELLYSARTYSQAELQALTT